MINTNRKQWINTSVEYQWSDELGKLVQISKEGYWYEGGMALCGNVTHDADVILSKGSRTTIYQNQTNIGVQLKSNGTGLLQLNCDGGGNVTLCENGNNVSITDPTGVNAKLIVADTNSGSTKQLGIRKVGAVTWYVSADTSSNLIFDKDGTEAMRIDTNGKVGIGDASPSYKLEVAGTFYSSGSSIEYKQDVKPYTPPEGALMSLKPVQYDYKDEWKDFGKRYAGNSSKQLGFVAEDVAKILPELAVTKSEGGKEVVRNVDYEKLTVLLVSEVQNLRKELNEIKGNSGNN